VGDQQRIPTAEGSILFFGSFDFSFFFFLSILMFPDHYSESPETDVVVQLFIGVMSSLYSVWDIVSTMHWLVSIGTDKPSAMI
jgi:hypothetical protein